jgi:hypothetical protein
MVHMRLAILATCQTKYADSLAQGEFLTDVLFAELSFGHHDLNQNRRRRRPAQADQGK